MANKLYLYGTIGYDLSADLVRLALDEASDDDFEIRVNSGGGDVFEGQAIYSLLESWKTTTGNKVIIYVDGIAASIARPCRSLGQDSRDDRDGVRNEIGNRPRRYWLNDGRRNLVHRRGGCQLRLCRSDCKRFRGACRVN